MIISTRAGQLCPSPLRNKNVGYKESTVGRAQKNVAETTVGKKPQKIQAIKELTHARQRTRVDRSNRGKKRRASPLLGREGTTHYWNFPRMKCGCIWKYKRSLCTPHIFWKKGVIYSRWQTLLLTLTIAQTFRLDNKPINFRSSLLWTILRKTFWRERDGFGWRIGLTRVWGSLR